MRSGTKIHRDPRVAPGKLRRTAAQAKVHANDDHVVEIENQASEPVRLTEVRTLK
jgi:hypothetical protein